MRRLFTPFFVIAVMPLGLVTTGGMPTTAQEATPAAIPPVLVAWSEAWDALDADAIAALYAEDGVMEEVSAGVPSRLHAHQWECPTIEEGVALAQRVELLLREEAPSIVTEATAAELFALPNQPPFGQVGIDIFFYAGCQPTD